MSCRYSEFLCVVHKILLHLRFEYGVIPNGGETRVILERTRYLFEYGVIPNGGETCPRHASNRITFEYGVITNT